MQIVSFETAIKLRDAGFPQPEHWKGNIFHLPLLDSTEIGSTCICVYDDIETGIFNDLLFPQEKICSEQKSKSRAVYAPTATQILPHIFSYILANDFEQEGIADGVLLFSCYDPDTDGPWFTDANPAEACAAAWLNGKS